MSGAAASGIGIGMIIYYIVILAVVVLMIVSYWKIFEKAGKPGWAVLIPIYNLIVMLEIIGKPLTWILLAICLGPIFQILYAMELAERFGHDRTYGIIWLWLLGVYGIPKLAFGDDKYTAPANPA
ncbi:MAG: signal peptidase I [Leptospirales bacterium]|nr:signal peptidase I [Leptospirales bacterium]